MATIAAFVQDLVSREANVAQHEFTQTLSEKFYPSHDLSFMRYFLELAHEANDGEYVVPHQKLQEYGVITADRPSAIKDRLRALDLAENTEYVAREGTQANGKAQTVYMLTPEALKLALLRAKKSPSVNADPRSFAKYHLFLERVLMHYRGYQRSMILKKLDLVLPPSNETSDNRDVLREIDAVILKLQRLQPSSSPTVNSVDPGHNFVCMSHRIDETTQRLFFIAGQAKNVRTAINKNLEDPSWSVQVGFHCTSNPTDLRNKICNRVNQYIKDLVAAENTRRTAIAAESNEALRKEINQHNRVNKENRRSFKAEKINAHRITRVDVPITYSKKVLTYEENDFMKFDKLIEVMRSVDASAADLSASGVDPTSDAE